MEVMGSKFNNGLNSIDCSKTKGKFILHAFNRCVDHLHP